VEKLQMPKSKRFTRKFYRKRRKTHAIHLQVRHCRQSKLCFKPAEHDWEGYFESLAEQGFQNNLFFGANSKKLG